jgi:gas vesicle protein
VAREEEGTGGGSILLAFILGAVSGAALALLYAPVTGRETREFIGDRAREGRQRAADVAAEVASRGREAINQSRDVLSQGRETLTTAIERGKEAYQQARTRENA